MSNWNDNIDTTLSFEMEVSEEGKAYFERMLKERANRPNKAIWKQGGQELEQATATDVFNWWMEYDVLIGQQSLFDEPESDDDE